MFNASTVRTSEFILATLEGNAFRYGFVAAIFAIHFAIASLVDADALVVATHPR